jgi:hypothetical protein
MSTNTDVETKLREFHEYLSEERDHYVRIVEDESEDIGSDNLANYHGLLRAYHEIEVLFRLKFLQNSPTDNPS